MIGASKRLSPAFVELTLDTLLKAIWRKTTLRRFLQQHNVSSADLAQWHADQTKRAFLEWVWPQLVESDRGQNAILAMARSLADMRHFPDLEMKEDAKISILEAEKATTRLRQEVEKINESIQETKEAERRRQAARDESAARRASQESIEKLQRRLVELMPQLGTQAGGYAFERWFYDLAVFFDLEARPGYYADGRQIDGALTIEGTTYLLETKFTKEAVGSPDIDTFMAKIESKADNTMGLFVSIQGFSEGAVRSASKQRTPMLLLDYGHLFNLILRGVMTLPQVVSRIKRHASQTGSSYLNSAEFSG